MFEEIPKNSRCAYVRVSSKSQENGLLLAIKIYHCSSNIIEFLKLQERIYKKGVTFISLNLSYSNDMVVNK